MKTQPRLFIDWYKKNLSKRFSYHGQKTEMVSKKLIGILLCEPVNIEYIEDYFIENLTSKKSTYENEKLCPLVRTEVKKHIVSLAKEGSIKLSQIYDLYFGQYGGCGGEHDEACIGPIPLELNSLNSCSKLTEICSYIIKDLRRLFSESLGFWYKTDEELKNKTYVDLEKGNLSAFSHSFLHLPEIVTINAVHSNPQLFFEYIKKIEEQEKRKITKPAIYPKYLRVLFDQTKNIYNLALDSYEKIKFLNAQS